MAGVLFITVITNCVGFSFIFWTLTYLGKYFFSYKFYDYKLDFYECGFKNITTFSPQYNINFILLVLFLIIYDGEFLILIPYALNAPTVSPELFAALIIFFLWLCVAVFCDYSYHALDWNLPNVEFDICNLPKNFINKQ